MENIEQYMLEAVACARKHNTPYGAVIVEPSSGRKLIVANSVGAENDPTAHAEVNAIREAARQGLRLQGSILVSTCEPCPMCAMAAIWAGVGAIYFGATIDDAARHGHQVRIYAQQLAAEAWYEIEARGGILREQCLALF